MAGLQNTDLFTFTAAPSYPVAAGYKEQTTSKDAAERIESMKICEWLRKNIPQFLADKPRTAKELSADLNLDKDIVKPRLSELKLQHKVRWQRDYLGEYITRNYEHVWEAQCPLP